MRIVIVYYIRLSSDIYYKYWMTNLQHWQVAQRKVAETGNIQETNLKCNAQGET